MSLFTEIVDEVTTYWRFYGSAIGVACLIAFATTGCNDNNGIIAIDGYEHAMILCGTADQGGFLMVNNGHYKDAELNDLFKAAQETCPHVTDDFYSK